MWTGRMAAIRAPPLAFDAAPAAADARVAQERMDKARVHLPGRRIGVDEDGLGPGIADGIRRRDEGES